MGRVHSIQQLEVCVPSRPGEWILIGRTDYCQLLKNTDTGFEAEQYVVQSDPNIPLLKTYEIYDYRRKQQDNLVQVYQVQNQPQSYICQGEDYIRVKTQRIPRRLSEVGVLSQQEGIYILQQSLIGYKTIFNFKGPVSINDDMIGFNKNGQVKVWLNNNFAKNYPDIDLNPPRYSQNTYHPSNITNQTGMVRQVVDVVQQHIDQTQFRQFLDIFYSVSPKTFTQTLHILQQYSKSRGIKTLTGFRTNATIINNIRTTQQQNIIPSQKTILTQTQIIPSITTSIQSPLQPQIIQNYPPSSIVRYQPQTNYYDQQPIREITQQITGIKHKPFVHLLNNNTPRTIHVVSPNSQIIQNNTKINNTIRNEIVSPLSQIRPNVSQNRVSPLRLNHRPSNPSIKFINNQTQIVQLNARSPQNKLISPPKAIIENNHQRNHSPTIFRPTINTQQRTTSIPKTNISTIKRQNNTIITPASMITKNDKTNIVHTHSQLTHTSHKKQQYRKSHVQETNPTNNIDKTLHGVQRVNSIGQNPLELISPTLVTANPIKQEQIIQNKTNISNPIIGTIHHKTENISQFRGLPHKRDNINTPLVGINTKTQIISQNQQIINPKSSIMTQQTILDKLQNNVNKAVFDFSDPIIKNQEPKDMFASFGINQQNNHIVEAQTIQTNIRPTRPHPQQKNQSNISNYQPFKHIRDNKVHNIQVIQQRGSINPGFGISTFTNSIQQKPQIQQVVFTQVKSSAINDSVDPQIRKLMILPKQNNTQIHETNIIQNIPIAQSQFPETIVQQKVLQNKGNNLISTETVTKTNNQNISKQNNLQTHAEPQLQKDHIVHTKQILNQNNVQLVCQTINNQQKIQNSKKQTIDIQLMMRQHEQQSKNLFMKYEQYGRSIERQLSPNNPTSPSSLQKQLLPLVQPHIQQQQIIVVDYQPQSIQDQQLYNEIQTKEYQYRSQVNNNITKQIRVETNIIQNFNRRDQPIIINQEVTQTIVQNNQSPEYQYLQQYNTINNQQQIPNNRESPRYEYVTNDQQYTNYQYKNPYYREQNKYERQNIGQSINFKETTQSYNYDDKAFSTIYHSRGTAPTYEQLRAALLETNLGLQQADRQLYQNEYKYETRQYD